MLGAVALCVAGAVGAWAFLQGHAHDCAARWRDSGLRVTYRDGQCLVEAGSRWYPEQSVKIHVRR
jgi:hypothetical protein